MLPRRTSSRTRYVDYLRSRRNDPTYARRSHDGKSPNRYARHRTFGVLFRAFWRLLRGHRGMVFAALATLSVVTVTGLAIPASTKIAIDYIITDHPGPTGLPAWARGALPESRTGLLWRLGLAMVALALFGVILGTFGRYQMTRLVRRVGVRLRRAAFDHASRLPLHRVHHHKSGGMASLLREDPSQAADLLFSMIYNPWRAVVQLAGTLVILAFVDWRMLVGALALLPAIWVTHKTWIARIRPVYRDIKLLRQRVDAATTEAFAGVRIVRGFNQQRAENVRFGLAQHLMARQEMLVWWWSRLVEIAWAVMIPLASAAVLIYGGTRVVRGDLTIGDMMMFSTYLLMLLGPLETLTSTATNIQGNLAGLDRVLDLLEEPTEFAGAAPAAAEPVERSRVRGRIEFRDVWFAYPRAKDAATPEGRDAPRTPAGATPGGAAPGGAEPEFVIKGVSLVVEPGETIALVGPSGSGKTTLCNLVARFYDPTRGAVLLDGRDLRSLDATGFRRLLGIVEQDVFLFDGTVFENIAYARREATPEAVMDAARSAHAHDFIERLDKGYETVIGERGVRLSGGQKQRLAIARALLADPRILILDEATSNLDAESEALIQKSLAGLMHGRTCFVIAHRLSTVRHATRIVVVDGGVVREMGTHEELLARGGRYAELLAAQVEANVVPRPARSASPAA